MILGARLTFPIGDYTSITVEITDHRSLESPIGERIRPAFSYLFNFVVINTDSMFSTCECVLSEVCAK